MTENPDVERPDETVPFPPAPEPAPHGDPVAPPPPPPSGYAQPTYGQPTYAQPGYAQPSYGQPSFAQPAYGYSDKSKVVAGLLQVLLPFIGICGVGRLYAGHIGLGLTQLLGMFVGFVLAFVLIGFLIMPAIWLWTVIDGIIMLTSDAKDGEGRLLRP